MNALFQVYEIRSESIVAYCSSADQAKAVVRLYGAGHAWRRGERQQAQRPGLPPFVKQPGTKAAGTGPWLYVYDQLRNEIVATVKSKTSAILAMSRIVPTYEDAQQQFRIVRSVPAGAAWRKEWRFVMPWGKYEGQDFQDVPWQYLDRCLSPELKARDPVLFEQIEDYLSIVPEYLDHRYHEQNYHRDYNHVRDFNPSESRGR